MSEEWVKEDFELLQGELVFRSSISFPKSQFDTISAQDKEALKQKMFDDWLAVVTKPQEEE